MSDAEVLRNGSLSFPNRQRKSPSRCLHPRMPKESVMICAMAARGLLTFVTVMSRCGKLLNQPHHIAAGNMELLPTRARMTAMHNPCHPQIGQVGISFFAFSETSGRSSSHCGSHTPCKRRCGFIKRFSAGNPTKSWSLDFMLTAPFPLAQTSGFSFALDFQDLGDGECCIGGNGNRQSTPMAAGTSRLLRTIAKIPSRKA